MADKLFKSLTIGGDTFSIPDNLGVIVGSNVKIANLPANTLLIGNDLTITSPGVYIVGAIAIFTAATTTGLTKRNYGIVKNGSYLVFQTDIDADNSQAAKRMFVLINISESELPYTIQAGMSSSRAANGCSLEMNAAKLF